MVAEQIQQAVLRLAEAGGKAGVAMGQIVDELVGDGFEEKEVEHAIWELLQHRRLTPNGFVARTLRTRGRSGEAARRVYEFVLIPWSPALDHQLDLQFDGDERS